MARWPQFDLEAAIWTIPEDRTKSGRKHRVPLSSGALMVLDQATALGDGERLVFPGHRLRPLGESAMSLLLRRFGIP